MTVQKFRQQQGQRRPPSMNAEQKQELLQDIIKQSDSIFGRP